MKNEIKFDFFGDQTATIYFDIKRLRDICRITKMNLNQLITSEADIDLAVTCLMVGLRHIYKNKTEDFYLQKIDEYLSNEERNGAFIDIWTAISLAISASGIFGNKIAKAAANNSIGDVATVMVEENQKNA